MICIDSIQSAFVDSVIPYSPSLDACNIRHGSQNYPLATPERETPENL